MNGGLRRMFQRKIAAKMAAGYVVVGLLIVGCAGAGYFGMTRLSGMLDYLMGPAWDTADGAMEASIEIEAQMLASNSILDGVEVEANTEVLASARESADECIERMIAATASVEIISTGGDAFYFPKLDDPEKEAAQLELASLMLSKEVQVNFNLKKGSLPVRGDVDLAAANDCMKKGLAILGTGAILPDGNQTLSPDTQGQIEDLMTQFWSSDEISAEEAQKRYAEIIASAD